MNVESMGNHHSIAYIHDDDDDDDNNNDHDDNDENVITMMMMMMMMMIKIVNSDVTAVPSFLREGSNQAIRCDEITMMIIML